jgi:hypothetical protein
VLLRVLYRPICRAYGQYVLGDRPADRCYRNLCSLQFRLVHRYRPDFVHPKSFNEKLWSRMLHDRDPRLTLISDKLQVRDYVAHKAGGQSLIPLLWSGDNPEEIPFGELPMKYVIKTNHGCHYVIVVNDKEQLDQRKTKRQSRRWLGTNFGQDTYLGMAWGYKNIKPTILIESFIEENGKAPVDYKFHCFSGRVEFILVHHDRFEELKMRSVDMNFEPYDFRYDYPIWEGECRRPENFEDMVCLAETLSEEFDFLRVDLYNVGGRIYFGELTPYPGGGFERFFPLARDRILGELWECNKGRR